MSKGEELSRLPGSRVKLSFRQDCSCVLLSTQAHLDLVATNLGASAPGIEIISDVGATKKHMAVAMIMVAPILMMTHDDAGLPIVMPVVMMVMAVFKVVVVR